jgi:hypothetical protein
MDSIMKPSPSEAHPETMDFLSSTWCNFAVQALQPDLQNQPIILLDNPIKKLDCDVMKPPFSVSQFVAVSMFAVFYDLNVIGAKDMNGGLFVYLAEDGQECQNG